jgi:predicted phage terminase large subunit-like protein
MTRWAQGDLTGRVVQDMVRNPESDQWEVVEFPAIFDKTEVNPDTGESTTTQVSLWPEQWSLESLLRTKASMPPFQWNAQYMQTPTSAEATIIKRDWWQKWEHDDPPTCDYVIMSLDAAAEKNNRADFTALTTWGVFEKAGEDGEPQNHIILLNSIKERWEFPTLKRRVYEEYKKWSPDWLVVEKKSAGTALYQEMRAGGVPVQEYTPHRGSGDKTMRLNSVSDIFASGFVWYPAGRRWAEEVVDEVCGFPTMPHDDLCLASGTRIMMADGGEKNIVDVVVGDAVATPFGPRKVTASACTGVRQTVRLMGVFGSLEITDNHPVATARGWVTPLQMRRDDDITYVETNALSFRASKGHIENHIEQPVYNLTVEGAHCYFANGVLVHNCDSTVMALMRFRSGGFIRLPSDRFDEDDVFIPRRAEYY